LATSPKKRLALIPARGGSKRIPKKNIKNFLGRPIILRVLEEVSKSAQFDEIHVSTDCPEIFELVSDAGFVPAFYRDKSLADDHSNLADVVSFVVSEMEQRRKTFDTIMLIFPTAFNLSAEIIVDALVALESDPRELQVLSVARFDVPIQWAMSLTENDILLPMFPEKLNIRSQDLVEMFHESADFVIYRASSYQRSNLQKKGYIVPYDSVDIDTEKDWRFAEALFSQKLMGNE
tara:strand:+ start:1214 stop:1915 length:702 start_codon:yes stop_codon:yes gene_type:complete